MVRRSRLKGLFGRQGAENVAAEALTSHYVCKHALALLNNAARPMQLKLIRAAAA